MPATPNPRSVHLRRPDRALDWRVFRTLLGRLLTVVLALTLAVAALVLPSASASAADSYRFWGFFQLNGTSWTFAAKGADQIVPADGSVDGWRLAVGDMSVTHAPRAALAFETICAAVPAQAGKKRVGVVLDFGRPADQDLGGTAPAPRAQCAVVETSATSQAVLVAIAPVRAEKGMVCAVENTPATGCGAKVASPPVEAKATDNPVDIPVVAAGTPADPGTTSPSADPSSSSPSAAAPTSPTSPTESSSEGPTPGTVLLVLLVLVAVALAIWLSVRRRHR